MSTNTTNTTNTDERDVTPEGREEGREEQGEQGEQREARVEQQVPPPPTVAEALAAVEEPSAPPALSGNALLRRGLARWALTGVMRLLYRRWTRIAARVFPEGSRQAALATRLGVELPDRLNMNWITPQLAVGGRVLPEDIHRLAQVGVTRVVDTRAEQQDDEQALGKEGIKLLYLPTPDTYPLSVEQLQEGADWVNRQIAAGQKVLIHCEHGVGRSVLLTAAALVEQGMSATDAVNLIQRRRWQAAPNHRQMQRLQEFEREVRQEEAAEAKR